MYLVSTYFQDPQTLGLSPLGAGLATLPATVGLVSVAPMVSRLAARFGGRQVVCRIRDNRRWVRRDRLGRHVVAVRRLRPAPAGRRDRDGTLQRTGEIGSDGVRPGDPGRGGIRCFQHGPLRRRGRGHGARRLDLRQRLGSSFSMPPPYDLPTVSAPSSVNVFRLASGSSSWPSWNHPMAQIQAMHAVEVAHLRGMPASASITNAPARTVPASGRSSVTWRRSAIHSMLGLPVPCRSRRVPPERAASDRAAMLRRFKWSDTIQRGCDR